MCCCSLIVKIFFEPCSEDHKPAEEKKLATWGTDVPDDLVLDEKLLAEALKKVKINLSPYISLLHLCVCYILFSLSSVE